MELTGFEFFAFFLCSSVFGLLFSVWTKSELISDREITLLVTFFVAAVGALLAQLSTSRALTKFLTKDVGGVHEKQLKDLSDAHRRHVAGLKNEHNCEHLRLLNKINDADVKLNRMHTDHEFISAMYQEQMRNSLEQDDRILYLENKLQEFGQSTPVARAPFSAPPTKISFSSPPRRQRSNEGYRSPGSTSSLSQVVETEDE